MSSMARGSTCGGLVAGSVEASAVGYEAKNFIDRY